ncbi:13052_t:CDS:1, partial [Funneliformis caledonium]
KSKMPEIGLNCLVIPRDSVERIKQQHIIIIKINNNESVHSLRSQIKKEYTSQFDDISITKFVICAISLNLDKVLASINAKGVMISVNSRR